MYRNLILYLYKIFVFLAKINLHRAMCLDTARFFKQLLKNVLTDTYRWPTGL